MNSEEVKEGIRIKVVSCERHASKTFVVTEKLSGPIREYFEVEEETTEEKLYLLPEEMEWVDP